MLDNVRMNMSIEDPDIRQLTLDRDFTNVLKKASGFELEENAMVLKYASALHPAAVRHKLEAFAKTKDVTLATVMEKSRQLVIEQHKCFEPRSSVMQERATAVPRIEHAWQEG